jgi:aryl-alcohol dehydrogenase-like predicted oxidoreductase
MRYKRLGTSELNISRIGVGAWQAGGGDWAFSLGPQDDSDSIGAIRRATELGINWIDTAAVYGLGHSEAVVARALDGLSDRPLVFTKGGMPWDGTGRVIHCLRKHSIKRECEDSLRRLRVDKIDLYQLHWNKPEEEIDEGLEALLELRQEGKIRYAGVSNFNVPQLERAIQIAQPISLQPPYSLIDRAVESEILPFCGEKGLGVLVYSPMQSGLLSGKMTRERIARLPHDDLRRTKPEFQEPSLSKNLEIVGRLGEVAARTDYTVAEIAVAWTLHNQNVTAAIVGVRRPDQIEGIIRAAEIQLTPDELSMLGT